METNMMVLPGESIPITTQISFGNNGDKWREDELHWDYLNTVKIVRKLKHFVRDVALLGLMLWWARIHLKNEQWAQFRKDVDMHESAISRFKTFVFKEGLIGMERKNKPTETEIRAAIKNVNSNLATLQHLDMRKFWGVNSNKMVLTGPAEERHIAGFSPANVLKKLRRDWSKNSAEEKINIIDTLFVIQYLFSGFIKEIYNSGDPALVKEINKQYIMRSNVFMPEVEPE